MILFAHDDIINLIFSFNSTMSDYISKYEIDFQKYNDFIGPRWDIVFVIDGVYNRTSIYGVCSDFKLLFFS